MLVSIISAVYTCIIIYGIGLLTMKVIRRFLFLKTELPTIYTYIFGIISITVYVEIFSLFYKIGALAHILMVLLALTGFLLGRKNMMDHLSRLKKVLFSWEGLFYLGFLIFLSYFASRGEFHTDTNIYHAAAIRMYEEYGILKGLGNLQLHYAYNSSSLAFASIFSMNWLFGTSIHTSTLVFELVAGLYAFSGLKEFRNHRLHMADLMKAGILFYILVILYRSMSPATDFSTLLMAMMVICLWLDNMETSRDTDIYALISVAAVYVVTMKFSACLLVVMALYPAWMLIKNKKWKSIWKYLLLGIIVMAPFLIRNVILSGWLLYPFDKIDLFNVEWKIPKEYLQHDAAQITVWGRCLYEVSKLDWGIADWFGPWIENKERYELMLLYGTAAGCLFMLIYAIRYLIKKVNYAFEYGVCYLAIMACLALWFLQAPFIRYGLAFIFAVMLIPLGSFISEEHKGLHGIVTGLLAFCCIASLTPYFDNYITDMGVFIKQNLKEPYYICQKPYDDAVTGELKIGDNTLYYCDEIREINSYYYFPNTCYKEMLERTTLIGETIEEGFKAR